MLREPAGHPDHDAGVALPAAHLARARDAARRRDADPRRGARRRRHEARRAPRALGRAAGRARRAAVAAHRPVGDAAPAGGDRPLRLGRRGRSELVDAGRAQGARPRGRRPRRGHARARARRRRSRTRCPRTARRWTPAPSSARSSIWPSIYPELLRARRAAPLDDRLRQQPPPRRAARAAAERARRGGDRPRAPRLARARAAGRGRGGAEGAARSRASSPPRRSSSASTWAPSTSSIQVESPKSVARGLQRVGRAGHELGAVSKGRIFPKFRADLLESRGRRASGCATGEIEETTHPAQPARRARAADRRDLRRRGDRGRRPARARARARTRSPTSRATQLENVLDMLAGPLPVRRVRRAAAAHRLGPHRRRRSAARDGARRLAVTNAGTIPDRGLFGVFLVDGGGRVGELDEEMVYEARAGQTFLLGASTWRIEEITRDRVLVSPAPGVPGAVPFWKGEGVGRPFELGEAIGARVARARRRSPTSKALERLRDEYRARRARRARTCSRSCASRQRATGAVPSDRTIVVERFRDEIGDWRVCILTPFGGRVHAPWAMALDRAAARVARPRGAVDLVGRRHRAAPSRRRRAAADRRPAARPGRGRGPRRRRRSARRALFGARFRENAGARAADPAPPARASARRSGSSG